jgi:hypothetical protein
VSKPSIIQKLGEHLSLHMPPSEECHVLYLMAEIRKVLDRDNSSKTYKPLRFYANWCVHAKLDRPNKFINKAADEIEGEMQDCIDAKTEVVKGPKLSGFLSMEALRNAFKAFLGDNGLPTQITDAENWEWFQALLVEIVSEQPIIGPSDRIAKLEYREDHDLVIEFCIEPPKFHQFRFSQ